MKVVIASTMPVSSPLRLIPDTTTLTVIHAVVETHTTYIDGTEGSRIAGVTAPPTAKPRYIIIAEGTDTIDELRAMSAELEPEGDVEIDMDGKLLAQAQTIEALVVG